MEHDTPHYGKDISFFLCVFAALTGRKVFEESDKKGEIDTMVNSLFGLVLYAQLFNEVLFPTIPPSPPGRGAPLVAG